MNQYMLNQEKIKVSSVCPEKREKVVLSEKKSHGFTESPIMIK